MKIEGAKNSRAKIIDCTIRDGGLMNSSRFSDKTVRTVYDCCADSGAEYMEIGFKNSKKIFSPAEYGAWRFCDEGDIARIIGSHPRNVKLTLFGKVCTPQTPQGACMVSTEGSCFNSCYN